MSYIYVLFIRAYINVVLCLVSYKYVAFNGWINNQLDFMINIRSCKNETRVEKKRERVIST